MEIFRSSRIIGMKIRRLTEGLKFCVGFPEHHAGSHIALSATTREALFGIWKWWTFPKPAMFAFKFDG